MNIEEYDVENKGIILGGTQLGYWKHTYFKIMDGEKCIRDGFFSRAAAENYLAGMRYGNIELLPVDLKEVLQ